MEDKRGILIISDEERRRKRETIERFLKNRKNETMIELPVVLATPYGTEEAN